MTHALYVFKKTTLLPSVRMINIVSGSDLFTHPAGVCHDCGVWVGVHNPHLVGGMLLSLQRMAGPTPLCQKAFLCHRWVIRALHPISPTMELLQHCSCFLSLTDAMPVPSLSCFHTLPGGPLCEGKRMGDLRVPQHATDQSLFVLFPVVVRALKTGAFT